MPAHEPEVSDARRRAWREKSIRAAMAEFGVDRARATEMTDQAEREIEAAKRTWDMLGSVFKHFNL